MNQTAASVLAPPSVRPRVLPVGLALATVLAQIAYPLVADETRDLLTMVTVALFFSASVSHALIWRGVRWTVALVAVTAGGGLLVEALGVRVGVPFGSYAYTDTLPPSILGVPWVIPLAWTMMAYPSLCVARRITRSRVLGPLVAALALATWDLYLDPQMVEAGHWVWEGAAGSSLLGIPLTNFVGWLVTALLMVLVLSRWMPDRTPGGAAISDAVPFALYLWTYAGSLIAHAVFLGLPGSALVGGLGMGGIVAMFLHAVWRRP